MSYLYAHMGAFVSCLQIQAQYAQMSNNDWLFAMQSCILRSAKRVAIIFNFLLRRLAAAVVCGWAANANERHHEDTFCVDTWSRCKWSCDNSLSMDTSRSFNELSIVARRFDTFLTHFLLRMPMPLRYVHIRRLWRLIYTNMRYVDTTFNSKVLIASATAIRLPDSSERRLFSDGAVFCFWWRLWRRWRRCTLRIAHRAIYRLTTVACVTRYRHCNDVGDHTKPNDWTCWL